MSIKRIKRKGITKINYLQLVLVHIGIGYLGYVVEGSSKYILALAILYFLIRVISNQNRNDEILLAAGYITGFEVYNRMTGGFPFSYEFAKYAVIGFLTLGMFYRGFKRSSLVYVLLLVFLLPGILIAAINTNYSAKFWNDIGFNLSGPICLGICALYCYDRKMPFYRYQNILLALLLPIITTVSYLYLYTPNIRDALSGTQSNFETSGGFGPNQVATIIGLGMFILVTRLFIVKKRMINILDLILLGLIGYRGIVTFSRGGILTAVVIAAVFIFYYFLQSKGIEKVKLFPRVVIIVSVVAGTYLVSSIATLGLIDKRYSNQDAAGRLKQDISTGRTELIESELQAFFEYPLTGIGVGQVKEYRLQDTGRASASHNEMSRLLSEHGVPGLFALILLGLTPLIYRLRDRTNVYLFPFVLFWFLTINHSSMRIAAPAFIYGLCLISIVHAKKKNRIHRK